MRTSSHLFRRTSPRGQQLPRREEEHTMPPASRHPAQATHFHVAESEPTMILWMVASLPARASLYCGQPIFTARAQLGLNSPNAEMEPSEVRLPYGELRGCRIRRGRGRTETLLRPGIASRISFACSGNRERHHVSAGTGQLPPVPRGPGDGLRLSRVPWLRGLVRSQPSGRCVPPVQRAARLRIGACYGSVAVRGAALRGLQNAAACLHASRRVRLV